MPPKTSCSLPLLPLSPLPTTQTFRMLSRKDKGHKLRSSSSKIHRRSRSSNILLSTIQKISNGKSRPERSTMSLCSITSDECDLDDTMMDSFDDTIEFGSGQSTMIHQVSSYPTFPLFTRGNDPSSTNTSQESWVVTPPTPTRLTLKMRPSSFILPCSGNEFFAKYDESDDDYSDDEFVYNVDERSRSDSAYKMTVLPNNQIPSTVSTSDSVLSESVSFDENDENENRIPPTTPPSRYQDDYSNPRFISSPPLIRLIPKRIVYLPFHSHDNHNHYGNNSNVDVRSSVPSFNHNMSHLLLPDDF